MCKTIRFLKKLNIVNVTFILALFMCLLSCNTKDQTTSGGDIYLKDLPIAPTNIRRAVITEDSIFLLSSESTSIVQYPLNDGTTQSLDISANGVVQLMGEVQDFILDLNGDLNVLAFIMPMKESAIIRYNRATAQYSLIRLNKPIYAYHIDMDSEGNYYLLGFEPKLAQSVMQEQGVPETIKMVHKYSSDGQFETSFLPLSSPSTEQEFTEFFSSVVPRSNFVVLSSDEIYYHQRMIKIDIAAGPPLDRVHRTNGQGSSTIINLLKPLNCRLINIHKYRDKLAYEWEVMEVPPSYRVTLNDGTDIVSVPEDELLLALNDEFAAMRTFDKESGDIAISIISTR